MHLFCSPTGSLISAGRMFLGNVSCRHGSDCNVMEWDIFSCEPRIRITLYNSATAAPVSLSFKGINQSCLWKNMRGSSCQLIPRHI